MSKFVDWLKTEWESLERRKNQKLSTRKLSIAAGLSPNTLYQLLNNPDIKPSPETCHKLAEYFHVEPIRVLELAGHVNPPTLENMTSEIQQALERPELQNLLYSLQTLDEKDVQIVKQLVDQLRQRKDDSLADPAKGAAVALVVEDTADKRNLLVSMLRTAGLKVLEANNGEMAIELIEQSGNLIDIVITDYRMPKMDGVETTLAIRKKFPQLPILFVSAWDEPEMKAAAFNAGAAEYLVAPIDYQELVDAVTKVRRQ